MDVFGSWGGNWYVSYGGTSKWQKLNQSNVENVKIVDLNGDGKADVFSARDDKWYISYGDK
jgi:hypothetical protein